MLIKTKYIDCASKSVFNTWKLPTSAADTSGDIYWSAVVYIKDTGEVWTHGKLYGGFFSNADNNKVSLTIGGIEKTLALDGHVQHYTTLTGSGSTADQAILSTGEANKWTLKTLGKNAFSNVDYLPADSTAVAAEKVEHSIGFQYNGNNVHSFDGSEARILNLIQGDNVLITGDSQGNITIAADAGSDTVNTAGATNLIDRKLFLVGAESQTTSPKTYSNQYIYIGTDNCLYSLGKKVLTEHQAIYNLDLQAQVGDTVTKVTTFDPNAANNLFTLVQGTNVTLTPDTTNKKVTISSKDTTYDFYNLIFKQGDTVVDTYKPTTSPNKSFKAGTNVTLSGSNNEVIISTLDTKNTTGATNKLDTKLFLTGSLAQSDNSQTYTNSKVYIGIDNKLYSDDKLVSTEDHTHSYLPLSGGTVTGTLNALQFSAQGDGVYTNYRLYLPESASSIGSTTRPRLGRFDRAAGSVVLQLGTSNLFDIVDSDWSTTLLRVSSGEFTYKGTAVSLSGHTHDYLPLSGGTLTGNLYSDKDVFFKGKTSVLPSHYYHYLYGTGSNARVYIHFGQQSNNHIVTYGIFRAYNGEGAFKEFYIGGNGVLTWDKNIVLHAGNYNSYSPTLTGTGASGTWNISINGNASTASKLNNALTLQANGTSLGTYDGSAAKTFNLTYANVGAAASKHTHDYLPYVDTRDTDINPYSSGFTEKGLSSSHLKYNTTDGLNDGGTYHASIYIYPWGDPSGGSAHNLAFTDNGNMWLRSGTSAWGSWKKILNSSNYTDYAATKDHTHSQYLPLSGGTVAGQLYLTGLEEGNSDVTDNTELLTSYASNNGFSDASGKVYKRDAIKVYNYIKGKLDSVYSAIGHTHSYLPLAGGTMVSDSRISHSGTLYIGNSDNSGWVALQDICSQSSIGDGLWSIRTNGSAIFTTIKKVGSSDSYTLLGGGGQMAISRFVYANTDFGVQESTGTSDNIGRAQFWRDNDLGAYGVTLCHSQSSEYKTKIYHDYGNGGNLYMKSCSNGTWGGVYTLWNSGNFNPDTKVSKTGDTMTGGLSWVMNGVTSSISNGNSSFTHYQTNANDGHWFNKNIYIAGNVYGGTGYNRILAFKDEINSQVGGSKSAQMLWNSWSTDTYYGGAIQIREYGNVVDTQSAWGYSPAITFHWGNRAVSRFGMRSDGLMAVNDIPISLSTHTHTFASITSKPTTIAGYGITDAYTAATIDSKLSGYLHGEVTNRYDANTTYNFTYISISGGTNVPSGAQYGSLLTLPYRTLVNNTTPDFATQIFIPNGDDPTNPNDMFFRTSIQKSWNAWQKVITSSNISSQSVSYASSAGNADTLDGIHNQNILERERSGGSYSGTGTGWFRIAETIAPDSNGICFLLAIQRQFYYSNNENYLFSISISYGGGISITQLSGYANARLITKIRIDFVRTQKAYIDLYVATQTTTNFYSWYTIGCAKSYTEWTGNPTLNGTAYEFETANGCKSDRGFTGDLVGNAATTTKLHTARTLWGQSFDGTGNVSGSITGVNEIHGSGGIYIDSNDWRAIEVTRGALGTSSIGGIDNNGVYFAHVNNSVTTYMYLQAGTGLTVHSNISATGAITAKASSSDIRLKKDISSYSAIDIIRGHRSVKYHWNEVAKANSDIFNDDYWHYGLIAQDVQRDMPQMVSDVFKDYLVINYERLIPICWKGLQEVDDEVSRLKKKVRKLEMEIRELKQKGERL